MEDVTHESKVATLNSNISGALDMASSKDEVTIESTREGLYVKYGNLKAGPFKTSNDIDTIQVAQHLDVEPKKVFLAKLRAYSTFQDGKSSVISREAAVEVSETFTYTGDQPFYGRIQVTALSFPQSRYMQLTFHCKKAGEECPACDLASNRTIKFGQADVDLQPSPHTLIPITLETH